jgi:hypothetical protein
MTKAKKARKPLTDKQKLAWIAANLYSLSMDINELWTMGYFNQFGVKCEVTGFGLDELIEKARA